MEDIIQIRNVNDYTDYFGLEATNPLIGIVDLTTAKNWPQEFHLTFDVYAVLLMGTHCGEIRYGRHGKYDFDAGTIITYAPGQTINEDSARRAPFCPRNTLPSRLYPRNIACQQHQPFFLLLLCRQRHCMFADDERQLFLIILNGFTRNWPDLKITLRDIVCLNIELLLSYCSRFIPVSLIRVRSQNMMCL